VRIVQRIPRNLVLVICLGVPLGYTLLAGEGRAWVSHITANLHYLPIQFSQDPGVQKASKSRVEATSIGNGAHIEAYRAVQLALAPLRDCPAPDLGSLRLGAPLPEEVEMQLAKWVEDSSIVPVCLAANETDRAVAYFEWLNGASEGTSAHLAALPRRLGAELIERAYRRYEEGQAEVGYADWTRARRVVAGLPQETFGALSERHAAGARPAQQEYLRRDLATALSNQPLAVSGQHSLLATRYSLLDIRLLLANSYNESSRHAEAQELLGVLLDEGARDTRVWQQYGQSLLGQRRFAEAEKALQKGVSLAPSDSGALNRLGVLYMVWGRTDEAEVNFRRALESPAGKRSYWLWEHLGDVLAMQGEREGAREAYRSAIEHAPEELDASARAKLACIEKKC
jgi:Flp pilus assembly protein TadD